LPPQEFETRTIQLVASCYTDYTIPAPKLWNDEEEEDDDDDDDDDYDDDDDDEK
jgi:hypothetical protein